MKRRCPACDKPVERPSRKECEAGRFFPFCSQRCKLIDLGIWLDAKYTIPLDEQLEASGDAAWDGL